MMDNIGWIILIGLLIVLVILSFRPWRRKEQLPIGGASLGGNQNAAVRLDEIASLLRAGKKIEAIKVYRVDTGVGLAEAKAAVERLEVAGRMGGTLAVSPEVVPLTSTVLDGDALLAEIGQLVSQGKKIQAIKLYREQTGLGLAAAKAAVDRVEQTMRAPGF
jgi:ribosomal protein L7/L12